MAARLILCVGGLVLAAGPLRAESPGSLPDTLGRVAAQFKVAKAEVDVARARVEVAQERVAWAERMVKKGFMSPAQAQAEKLAAAEAELALLKAAERLKAVAAGRAER